MDPPSGAEGNRAYASDDGSGRDDRRQSWDAGADTVDFDRFGGGATSFALSRRGYVLFFQLAARLAMTLAASISASRRVAYECGDLA